MAKRKRKQKVLPRYFKWRDGRPRMEPGPALRELGISGVDLKSPAGQWLELGPAIERAKEVLAEWDAKRKGEAPPVRGLPKGAARTVGELWERYLRSSKFTELGAKTQSDYRNKANVFLEGFAAARDHEREDGRRIRRGEHIDGFRDVPVAAITGPHMHAYSETLLAQKGKNMTLGVMAVFRRLLSYAEIVGWRAKNSNPAFRLELPRPDARLRLATPAELEALVHAADALQLHAVGDAIVLALHSGQREMDTLSLPERIVESGRILLTQAKRQAAVDIRMTPFCAARMREAKARKRELLGLGEGSNIAPFAIDLPLILCERTREPYRDTSQFNKDWRKVRKAAAGDEELREAAPRPDLFKDPCPSVLTLKFLDLRDTAVTRLAMADCNKYQIASITGHALGSIDAIMKHYLVLNRDMADAAIDKLVAWLQKEGIAI